MLVFVDADVLLHPDALDRIRARLRDPALDAVFGSYDDSPEAPGPVSGFRNLLHHHVHHEGAGRAQSFWTGIGAVRRAAFDSAGGLDPERRWLEDVELGARLVQAGARIELDPAIQGTHLKRYTLGSMLHVDTVERAIPWVDLMLAGRAPHSSLNAGGRHRASALLALGTVGAAALRRPRIGCSALGRSPSSTPSSTGRSRAAAGGWRRPPPCRCTSFTTSARSRRSRRRRAARAAALQRGDVVGRDARDRAVVDDAPAAHQHRPVADALEQAVVVTGGDDDPARLASARARAPR